MNLGLILLLSSDRFTDQSRFGEKTNERDEYRRLRFSIVRIACLELSEYSSREDPKISWRTSVFRITYSVIRLGLMQRRFGSQHSDRSPSISSDGIEVDVERETNSVLEISDGMYVDIKLISRLYRFLNEYLLRSQISSIPMVLAMQFLIRLIISYPSSRVSSRIRYRKTISL